MAFTFENQSNAPVNVVVANGGLIYFFKNRLLPGDSWSCNPAAVWYDATVFFNFGDRDVDPAKHNWTQATALGLTTLGAALAVTSVALIPVTAGTSAVVTNFAVGVAVSGAVVAAAGVAGTIANAALNPATIEGLYGGDDYTIIIAGGINGIVDQQDARLTVTGAVPISLQWKNQTSGSSGSVKAEGAGTDTGLSEARIVEVGASTARWLPGVLHTMMTTTN
ncbi:MAG: hypothetical protein M5U01_28930 [Ardenticatenaceae bacterium]|nr:hypothetical protein [Ardenticatenaceae bacterium]HBY96937.1 hypothetical protein [Chloroflexota bacterium]